MSVLPIIADLVKKFNFTVDRKAYVSVLHRINYRLTAQLYLLSVAILSSKFIFTDTFACMPDAHFQSMWVRFTES